jgi:hypothetical protein
MIDSINSNNLVENEIFFKNTGNVMKAYVIAIKIKTIITPHYCQTPLTNMPLQR